MDESLLFEGFPPVTPGEWDFANRADLKGADYDKKLVWKTSEGFSIKPYYTKEDLDSLPFMQDYPGEFPFRRGMKDNGNPWEIQEDIWVDDPLQANKRALELLDSGVSSIRFCFSEDARSKFLHEAAFNILLQKIHINCLPLHFAVGNRAKDVLSLLKDHAIRNQLTLADIKGSIDFNIFSHLISTGNYYESEKQDFSSLVVAVQKARKHLPGMRIIGIDGSLFRNAGAGIVQELAFALSQANEYIAIFTAKGIPVDDVLLSLHFTFAAGSSFFPEMAKLKAARLLFSKLASAWNPADLSSARMLIHSVSGNWNQTAYDPYMNILRNSTGAMSAVLGGTDSLTVKAFNASYAMPDDFSERIARNIQLVLREEAYLDRVADPAAGSYYIENLVNSMASAAWDIFRKLEAGGGYLKAVTAGILQDLVESSAKARIAQVNTRREVVLGTNQYPDFSDKARERVNEDIAYRKRADGPHVVKPLVPVRAAEEFEQLRLKTEKQPACPRVFMFTYGNLGMRIARANFACNFFAVAGFELINQIGFESLDEGISAARESHADIVVICSSDDEYASIAPYIYSHLSETILPNGRNPIIVVAGAPACMDELRDKGITRFIHMKANLLETLAQFVHDLGY